MANEELLMQVHGHGGNIEVYANRVVIRRSGISAGVLGGVKEIPFTLIDSVQFKTPSVLTNGHIRFVTGKNDEQNQVAFLSKYRSDFETLQQFVEQKIEENKANIGESNKGSESMGLFKKDKKNSEVSFSIELKSSIGTGTDDTVQRLLKEASQKKRNGNLDGAIEVLKAAYKELDKHSWSFPIEVYLRLPLYLQESGKKDEAWEEFNRLVLWVNSKQRYSPEVTPMELSAIWDKMRLFLQREGNNDYAVQYAVWAYISWAVGLYMQKREEELEAYKAKLNIQKTLEAPLHKADKEFLIDGLTQIIVDALGNLPIVDYKRIAEAVQEEMKV